MVNAEKLELQAEIGSLEVGKMADFLMLDENPLDDILNTLSLRYTVQGGGIYDSATAKRIDPAALAEAANDTDAYPERMTSREGLRAVSRAWLTLQHTNSSAKDCATPCTDAEGR